MQRVHDTCFALILGSSGVHTPLHSLSGIEPRTSAAMPLTLRHGVWFVYLTASSETLCTFQEKKYHPGDSWHPYLEPHGLMFCIRCTCSQVCYNRGVSHSFIKCPTPPCENPVTETQQCCPKCLGLRAKQKSCHHNGVIYQAGEMFTSNDLFPLRRPNQCVLCSCSNGNIFCGLKTCLTLTCATPVSLPDTCCQVCKDSLLNFFFHPINCKRHSQNQCFGAQAKGKLVKTSHSTVSNTPRGINLKSFMHKGAAGTTMKIVLQEKHKRGIYCIWLGKTYSHGEVWHPVLRPHRILECILCTCKDGIQECKKMACPSEYPCEYPVKIEGKCCKTCPGNGNLPVCPCPSFTPFVPSITTITETLSNNSYINELGQQDTEVNCRIYFFKQLNLVLYIEHYHNNI
uniref:Chordin-like 2 n=1 Tax=Erpetoichthys calabaricus TaxID=27687 RepID=A0A8C4RVY9_ERPCA